MASVYVCSLGTWIPESELGSRAAFRTRELLVVWRHSKVVRPLLCLCLATGLLADEPPLPGRDPAFLARILADTQGGTQPWKTFKVPEDSGSAIVEVVGEYTPAELRQVAFQEFLVWFREDLRRFWRGQGFPGALTREAWSTVYPSSGHAVPQNGPQLRIGF